MNAGGASSEEPVENVFWGLAPVGTYKVYVQNYALKVRGAIKGKKGGGLRAGR